ncbi:hypothetical protein AMTR_s00063p00126130 [Amborella trichopoda]|uniref:Uncharacterized protein n=1 Tax=Amborella trichopoda TaxID=13333 RepID=U5D7A9_AMBTC|nr:hypothetical protein AMTR_s00063p00126130 [Amborella trichopoda]
MATEQPQAIDDGWIEMRKNKGRNGDLTGNVNLTPYHPDRILEVAKYDDLFLGKGCNLLELAWKAVDGALPYVFKV